MSSLVRPCLCASIARMRKLIVGPVENNVFVVRCKGSGEAVIVDAANEHELLLEVSRATGVRRVLTTHGHFDHIGSAAEFCGDDLPFYIHEGDVLALTDPEDAERPG